MTTSPPSTATDPVLVRSDDNGVATLTLNRPRQYNTLCEALIEALQDELDRISDDPTVRVVVLAGAGKAFCAGHDVKEMRANPSREYYEDLFTRCSRMMQCIVALPKPVIARVHGVAAAAGCQLVATCDLAVASTEARFAVPGVNLGLFCSTPSVALSRNVSRKRAFEMLFTGELLDAETAADYGLINRAVAPEDLDREVRRLVDALLGKSQVAIEIGKRMFYRQLDAPVAEAYRHASEVIAENMMAADAEEGIDAFIEKRTPTWKGP